MKWCKRNRNVECTEVTLRKSEIPEYLKQGELYRTLMENNDDPNEDVTFPIDVLKPNIQVSSLADCDLLLNSLRFWGVDEVGSKEIISYVLTCHETHERIRVSLQKYEPEFKFVYWLRQVMLARLPDRIVVAIKSGLIELVEPVFASRHIDKKQSLPVDACDLAAEVGNREVMQFLCKNRCKLNYKTSYIAARHGRTSILQFLVQNGEKLGGGQLNAAIEGGHMVCVQFISTAIALEWKRTSFACDTAARNGHLNILKYLHSEGFTWGNYSTESAAGGGHLHCLQYLHEQGCKWNIYTCRAAACGGHLHCLQYAHQHGCTINNFVANAAVELNQQQCLKYAHEHGCTWTFEQSGRTERVRFAVYGSTVDRIRTRLSSDAVWDYLRMHATIHEQAASAYSRKLSLFCLQLYCLYIKVKYLL